MVFTSIYYGICYVKKGRTTHLVIFFIFYVRLVLAQNIDIYDLENNVILKI